nr:MAG: major capsid protein [Microviridae sp.]
MSKITLGGKRLGSGKQMQVEQEDFGYSSHDLSNVFRSTMSAGTLVPFMVQQALPGDQWRIKLNLDCKTLPTIAPIFGSFKIQADIFTIPMRLYNSWVHNNKLNIGMNMSQVQIPQLNIWQVDSQSPWLQNNPTNYPINNANILKYLGISGAGSLNTGTGSNFINRKFNAIPLLGYWDIFKNYYANKQEPNAYVLTTNTTPGTYDSCTGNVGSALPVDMNTSGINPLVGSILQFQIVIDFISAGVKTQQALNEIYIKNNTTNVYNNISAYMQGQLIILPDNTAIMPTPTSQYWYAVNQGGTVRTSGLSNVAALLKGVETLMSTNYAAAPIIQPFPLVDIDAIRESILSNAGNVSYLVSYNTVNSTLISSTLGLEINTSQATIIPSVALQRFSQNGLLLKTYQSDIFNNWLNETTMTAANIVSNINTSAGYITIDAIELGYKVYRMLNQIAVGGGSYQDWQKAVYNHELFGAAQIPMYVGGLSKELVFSEIWSAAGVQSMGANQTSQPLGTLAGKGSMGDKHIGGDIDITVSEPSYIMGIVSLTPRLDYSQGNEWHMNLSNWDNLHKPHLDEIGFQDLITERLAWFGVNNSSGTVTGWSSTAIGKQPAWINYMTNFNRDFGQFAEANNLMCMVINRRYQGGLGFVTDATTYIEPNLYNYLFAYTSLDSQNFWMQILSQIEVRRKMSAKIMPNL